MWVMSTLEEEELFLITPCGDFRARIDAYYYLNKWDEIVARHDEEIKEPEVLEYKAYTATYPE